MSREPVSFMGCAGRDYSLSLQSYRHSGGLQNSAGLRPALGAAGPHESHTPAYRLSLAPYTLTKHPEGQAQNPVL